MLTLRCLFLVSCLLLACSVAEFPEQDYGYRYRTAGEYVSVDGTVRAEIVECYFVQTNEVAYLEIVVTTPQGTTRLYEVP